MALGRLTPIRIAKAVLVALLALVVASVALVYLSPETATRLAIDAERARAGLTAKTIDLPNGLHYAYLEGGQGEPLLLLHGFGENKDHFARAAGHLVPHYRVLVPDHIGFGDSAHPLDADYSPPAQAVRLHALTQALGIARMHLGGNSMGGQIALTYAAMYPADIGSLWVLDPAGIWSAPPSEMREFMQKTGTNPMFVRSADDFVRLSGFAMTDPPFVPRPMINVLAQERIRNVALEERIFKTLDADTLEPRIMGLMTPTLIVWGDRDRLLRVESAEILHRLLPRSRVVIMRGVGHLPMLERPAESAAEYLRFRLSLNP